MPNAAWAVLAVLSAFVAGVVAGILAARRRSYELGRRDALADRERFERTQGRVERFIAENYP